jgi:hypothetical protein
MQMPVVAFDASRAWPHSAGMLLILFVMIAVLGGAAFVGIAANERRRKSLPGGKSQKTLPAGVGTLLAERGLRDMRTGDVLTIDGRDFLCEGVLNYDEDGHRWVCGRVVDGTETKWMLVGIERAGSSSARMLEVDETITISGYPAETLLVGDVKYVLDKRGTATVKMDGDVGALGDVRKDRMERHAERCRWWLYNAPGDDAVLVEQFGADYRALRGKKIGLTTVELMPGS